MLLNQRKIELLKFKFLEARDFLSYLKKKFTKLSSFIRLRFETSNDNQQDDSGSIDIITFKNNIDTLILRLSQHYNLSMKEIEDLDIEHYFLTSIILLKKMKEKRLTLINKIGKMANENIIVKFQVEGADKFNKDIEKSVDVILMLLRLIR